MDNLGHGCQKTNEGYAACRGYHAILAAEIDGEAHTIESTAFVPAEGTMENLAKFKIVGSNFETDLHKIFYRKIHHGAEILKRMYGLPQHIMYAEMEDIKNGEFIPGVYFKQPLYTDLCTVEAQQTIFSVMTENLNKHSTEALRLQKQQRETCSDIAKRIIISKPYYQEREISEEKWIRESQSAAAPYIKRRYSSAAGPNLIKRGLWNLLTTAELLAFMTKDNWHIYSMQPNPDQETIDACHMLEEKWFGGYRHEGDLIEEENRACCKIVLVEHWLGRSMYGSDQYCILVCLGKIKED